MDNEIVLSPETIEKLQTYTWSEKKKDEVKNFEGCTIESDTNKGSFDAEKGAMYDYKITLRTPEGETYIGYGGYYTAQTGEMFDDEIVFAKKIKKPKKEKTSKLVQVDIYALPQNNGDGSASIRYYLTYRDAERAYNNDDEGFAEDGIEKIETFEGSNVHLEAIMNSADLGEDTEEGEEEE